MDSLEMKVWEYIREHEMISEGDKIVVGLSGGADSVFLFFIMLGLKERMNVEFVCVHVHHGIRGEEADRDKRFVEELCREYGIVERTFCYKVKEIVKERRISEEEVGRILRYESFRKVMTELAYNKIAVAHNLGDQAETIIHHLCRGSGLDGLAGIEPVTGEIIRPLLCLDKKEIERWLTQKGKEWKVDSTNLTGDYTRNRIRGEVLPLLEDKVNKEAVAHIAACGEALLEVKRYINKRGIEAYHKMVEEKEGEIGILLEEWEKEDVVIQKKVWILAIEKMASGRKDITSKHIQALLELAEKEVGKKIDLPGEIYAQRGYEKVYLKKKMEEKRKWKEEIEVCIKNQNVYILSEEWLEGGGKLIVDQAQKMDFTIWKEIKKIPENTYTKWFDYDKIKDTLLLRNRREGDYIELGTGLGRKKLKKFFIDQKVPKEKRDSILVLADGNHVLWIIGYRISEGVKITENTKYMVKIHLDGGNTNGRKD